MDWEKNNKRGTILKAVNEMFSREVNNCGMLLVLSSMKEKVIQEKMFKKNSSRKIGRIFLNFDSLVELCFSMIWTLKDLLIVFFKERKERRGEKWELELEDKKILETKEGIQSLKELGKRFEIEKGQEFGLLAKEQEERRRKEQEERRRKEQEEEEKRKEGERGGGEEEEDFQLEFGGIYLEFLPSLVIEYCNFHRIRCSFHEKEVKKVSQKILNFPNYCFSIPNGRLARDSLYADTVLRLTSSQRERILLQCFCVVSENWVTLFFDNRYHLEKIRKNKLAKNIEEFWRCHLPRSERNKCDSKKSEEEEDQDGSGPKEGKEEEEEEEEVLCWPYSESVLFSEEWISQTSSVLQSDVKDLIKFVNVLDELQDEALSFENKLTKEGKELRRFCEIFLDYCPRFTDLVVQWSNCYCLLVNSLKKIPSRGFKEELLSLETFFLNIFKPLIRMTAYLGALLILDYWGGVKMRDQEILSKTVVCYQQMVRIPADSFGKLSMKGRLIKGAAASRS